ncbi:MAG TPA: BMP family protein [Clostridia bacterium]|nr:BMP family protein [Clostridia bacterium]
MKTKWIRLLALMLVLILSVGVLVACDEDGKKPKPNDDSKIKVALIMEGSVSDMSWNATAFEGLKKIEALGAQVGHTERTPVSDAATAIRTYADDGYDVIFMSTSSYSDIVLQEAPKYPDVHFFVINAIISAENVRSFGVQDAQQGYLMGALAALLTKSGTVGFIGGLEIAPILNGAKGFEQGVKYVDSDIKIISQNTGSMQDVSAAKELGKAFVSQGVDVLCPMANQAALGVMEAAEETGVLAIGSGENQETVAPNAAVVAVMKDTSFAYEAAYKSFLAGEMPMEVLPMGAAQGVVFVGDYYMEVDQAIKDQIDAIQEKLVSGEITINLG